MITMCTRSFAITFIAPALALLPAAMPLHSKGISRSEAAALHASVDPSLGSLRAGRVDAPASFTAQERADLAVAQHRSNSLAALRAGDGPSDNEWKWLAIGAGVVLLIVLL
jgi:hypothetical protein